MRPSVGILVQLLACAAAGWCQLAPSPDESPKSTAPSPLSAERVVATFKQDVNLVDLFFTVKNGHGRLIPHLGEQNCTVLDEGVPQTFKSFVAETNEPLTLGILLDTS